MALHDAPQLAATPHAPGLFLALAPMDGVTDWIHRQIVTDQACGRSGVSLCVSEFVRVTRQPASKGVLLSHCPELARGGRTRAGVPVFVQLLGGEPEPMARSALTAVELGAPGIDLNFGCPAKRVNQHDGGASLLRAPQRIERMVGAVRRALDGAVPVSAKIRTGWDSAREVEVLARAAEQGGADWLTIHGRTRVDMYKPPADWEAIGRARQAVDMPVVANGDVYSPETIARCARVSGCSAFMIGRGMLAYPTAFRAARGWLEDDEEALPVLGRLLLDYVQAMREAGVSERAALGRLKQWLCIGHRLRPELAPWFELIKRCELLDVAAARVAALASAPVAASAEELARHVAHEGRVGGGLHDRAQLVLGRDAHQLLDPLGGEPRVAQ